MKRGTKLFLYSAYDKVPPQIVEFEGIQRVGVADFPDFSIYTITINLEGHPAGSTVSRPVLESDFGYVFPSAAP